MIDAAPVEASASVSLVIDVFSVVVAAVDSGGGGVLSRIVEGAAGSAVLVSFSVFVLVSRLC